MGSVEGRRGAALSATRLHRLGLPLLVAFMAAAAVLAHPPHLDRLREQFADPGPWSAIAFVAVYSAVMLSPLPKTVFTLAAGALFGVGWGLLVVVTGATAGALMAFASARVLGRDAVRRLGGRWADQLDHQLQRRGLWAILFLRLVPAIPFTVVNYLAGATGVRLRDFALGTVVGMIPATTAYVMLGAYGTRPASWPFWGGLAGLALLSLGGLPAVRRRLRATASVTASGPPVAQAHQHAARDQQ